MTSPRAQTIRHATSRPVHLVALVSDVLTGGWCLTLVAIALLVAWRRLAGALTAPNDNAVLLAVCLAVSLLSLLVGRMPLPRGLAYINGVGPLVLAAVLTFPDSGWPVWLMLWSVAAVPLARLFGWPIMPPRTLESRHRGEGQPSAKAPAVNSAPVMSSAALTAGGTMDDTSPDDVVQELTRGTSAAGNDTLVGRIRVRLEPGARSQRAHVAFCPPFASAPAVTLAANDPEGPQIRVGQVLPQGVRFDLKRRSGSDLDVEVEVRFRAVDASRSASE